MLEVLQQAFWATSTALVALIVPIIAIRLALYLFVDIIMGRR